VISIGCDSVGLQSSKEITMAWTEITRRHYRRDALRYASDLTNAEWALISPFMPIASKVGRPRKTNLRSVVEAIRRLTRRLARP
jgi:hypothetical protein